jgi:hypothetical protein
LVNPAHAHEIPTVSGAVKPGKRKRHGSAVPGVLGHRGACGHRAVEQRHAAVGSEEKLAGLRVDSKLT